jgi:hypothetical protein
VRTLAQKRDISDIHLLKGAENELIAMLHKDDHFGFGLGYCFASDLSTQLGAEGCRGSRELGHFHTGTLLEAVRRWDASISSLEYGYW